MRKETKKWELTGTNLKWIALVTMITDHIGVALLPEGSLFYWAARLIGRLAFPLYSFLLVEGFCHTGNVGKYLRRLLVFALISEIPYDLMKGSIRLEWLTTDPTLFWEGLWRSQNVYFTLALGLVALLGYVRLQNQNQTIPAFLWCMAISGMAVLLRTDYDFTGIALICIFYRFRQEPQMRMIWGAGTLLFAMSPVEATALADFGLIHLYNGKRSRREPWKWQSLCFYAVYPAHLLVLWGLAAWMKV